MKRVLVLGLGSGGLSAVKSLAAAGARVEVVAVERSGRLIFKPGLTFTATGFRELERTG